MPSTPQARKAAATPSTDVFTCPECGKTFTRAAALGAHRKLKHGVAGASANAASNGSRRRTRATAARRRTTASAATSGNAGVVDRNALLRTLFPSGIPPREEVITEVNAWLDEAERLARSS